MSLNAFYKSIIMESKKKKEKHEDPNIKKKRIKKELAKKMHKIKNFEEFLKEFNDPEKVFIYLMNEKVEWGEMKNPVCIQWPDDIIKNKIGICLDHSIFMHCFCKRKGIENRILMIDWLSGDGKAAGHAMPLFKLKGKVYAMVYLSPAQGWMAGPYSSWDECADDITHIHRGAISYGYKKEMYTYWSYFDDEAIEYIDSYYNRKLTQVQFMQDNYFRNIRGSHRFKFKYKGFTFFNPLSLGLSFIDRFSQLMSKFTDVMKDIYGVSESFEIVEEAKKKDEEATDYTKEKPEDDDTTDKKDETKEETDTDKTEATDYSKEAPDDDDSGGDDTADDLKATDYTEENGTIGDDDDDTADASGDDTADAGGGDDTTATDYSKEAPDDDDSGGDDTADASGDDTADAGGGDDTTATDYSAETPDDDDGGGDDTADAGGDDSDSDSDSDDSSGDSDDEGDDSSDDSGSSDSASKDDKLRKFYLLKDFRGLQEFIKDAIEKVTEKKRDSFNEKQVDMQVVTNFNRLLQVIGDYMVFKFDEDDYTTALYNYRRFFVAVDINLELLEKLNEYKEKRINNQNEEETKNKTKRKNSKKDKDKKNKEVKKSDTKKENTDKSTKKLSSRFKLNK